MESHEGGGASGTREHPAPLHNVVPLNSKRLMTVLLKQLAGVLEVPTTASSDDLRQLITGKLEELGREPMNVQVTLQSTAHGTHLTLRDAEGEFLDAEPQEKESSSEEEAEKSGEGSGSAGDVESLQRELREASAEKEALQSEVSSLKEELQRAKQRVKDMWRTICEQLAAFDEIVTSKEE